MTSTMSLQLPFTGREKQSAQLQKLYKQRKHVLILGLAGVGKSALIEHMRRPLPLLVSRKCATMTEICECLETELKQPATEERLVERKQKLFKALAAAKRTVVFDGVDWTTPKMSAFLEWVSDRVPIWICTRSEHSWDIGHFWPFLWKFARVELQPFHLSETQTLIESCVEQGTIPPGARNIVEWLHRRSYGSPLVLRELLDELTTHQYDLSNPNALRLLDLDRRIHEIFPQATALEDHTRGRHD